MSPRRRIGAGFAALLVGALAGASRPSDALADDKPTLSGTWSASSLSEKWSTSDWGDACGPKPTGQGAPGGSVTIAEQGGELTMTGAGRTFSTSQCWEQMPGLARSSHSAGSRGWSTRCTSPSGDPRHATIVTNISATDDTIVLAETGNYEFFIEGATCRASVSRSRSFKLVQRAGEAPPAPSASAEPAPQPSAKPPPAPTSEPPPSGGCSEPGPPTKLEVRPSKKLMRPGETFALTAVVSDDKGCRVGAHPTFRLDGEASKGRVSVDADGKISVASDAAEGVVTVIADLGGKQVKVSIEVVASDRYDAILKERGLNPSGEDDRAASVEIATGLGGAESKGEDVARKRKQVFIAVVSGVAALLALGGLILLRRGRRPRPEADRASEAPAEPPAVAIFEKAPNQPMRCPTCAELFEPGTGFCPNDGVALSPATDVAPLPPAPSRAPRSKRRLEKICPTCGERFDGDAAFCGKDGTSLVPVN